eukprot:CAMPEP_0184324196 /NCGR_PEP_ID=MMETSP1049-20130417/134023_1 /TAXON_ID=77928 /ORGANISM="Proteomonas sulcata, Strain CCMP704" /LENGTH=475 /DNA_ID=CAMNT_0026645905 /DNA_START=188 /DNA_END=1612 /DNA_ORIENTATION=-
MRAKKTDEELTLIGSNGIEEVRSEASGQELGRSPKAQGNAVTLWLLYLVCAIEGVDLQLLPASFKALESDLGFGPGVLGALSMGQALFLATSGPVWGSLADRGMSRKSMLSRAALAWGIITVLLGSTSELWIVFLLRCLNGIALAALVPISQSLIADLTQDHNRGLVFGLVQCSGNLGRGISSMAVTAVADDDLKLPGLEIRGWRAAFMLVGLMSLVVSFVVTSYMVEPARDTSYGGSDAKSGGGESETRTSSSFFHELRLECRMLLSYFRIKSFVVILTQGAFGMIPWSSLTFLTLFLQYCGLSDLKAGIVSMTVVFSCGAGGIVGGVIGDRLTKWSRFHGRPCTAQISVLAGMIAMAILLCWVPKKADSFAGFMMVSVVFGVTASWAAVGCNSPMLLELVDSGSRSRIIALLIAVNGATAAVLGGPVVGFLSQAMGYNSPARGVKISDLADAQKEKNLNSLTKALLVGTIPPW